MNPDDFARFYRAAHGHDPFPWQSRLCREVCAGGWPAVLALPTAAGKTSAIDIAVFALALEAGRPLADRRAPLRVFFVVDRRLVVDQAAEHARGLRAALLNPTSLRASDEDRAVVVRVAESLSRYGGGEPLRVAALRGGVYRDDRWADSPNQPTVCVTTVDQVGSRLLFRGYGLGEFARPVHAGLAGNDALYLLDEAHLSQPFLETLRRVGWYRDRLGSGKSFGPFRVVEISATPATPVEEGGRFGLGGDDRANAELSRRLLAPKPAALSEPARFEQEAVARAEAARASGFQVVGVVVNRVASAREVFRLLPGEPLRDKVLLTGRVRPWDRDQILGAFLDRVRAGRDRTHDTPFYVAATMTVEVGADLDFDYLVTEAAPLASLRQRFGRLDRLGRFKKSRADVLLRKQKGEDPVYGPALAATWEWLNQTDVSGTEKVVDFGVNAFDALLARVGGGPVAAPVHAPVMFPAHLDLWTQTSPEPVPGPDVAPFLHGPDALGAADVQVVWRADLDPSPDDQDWVGVVAVAPPRSREALPLPFAAALGWLGENAPEVADQEGTGGGAEPPRGIRPVLCWRGPEASFVAQSADDIRPGDTLVVPATYGGLDAFGWDPRSTAPVEDVADGVVNEMADAAPGGRRRVRVRIYRGWGSGAVDALLDGLTGRLAEGEDTATVAEELFAALGAAAPAPLTAAVLRAARAAGLRLNPYPGGLVLTAKVAPGFVGRAQQEKVGDEVECDDGTDGASLQGAQVTLCEHLAGVAGWADRAGVALGLPSNLRHVLVRAAELHDLGKADWRFQYLLYGDEPGQELLAKSGRDLDPAREHLIREQAGLPPGFRHEFVSVALVRAGVERLLGALPDEERQLAEYLVGTHHGRGRPFPPFIPETRPEPVSLNWEGSPLAADANHGLWRLEAGWAEQFWTLVGRYGPWGLAFLETVLRLADGARSAEEARR